MRLLRLGWDFSGGQAYFSVRYGVRSGPGACCQNNSARVSCGETGEVANPLLVVCGRPGRSDTPLRIRFRTPTCRGRNLPGVRPTVWVRRGSPRYRIQDAPTRRLHLQMDFVSGKAFRPPNIPIRAIRCFDITQTSNNFEIVSPKA